MKKLRVLSLIAAALMTAACVLSSCGEKIYLATGSETGTYYAYGMAVSNVITAKTGIDFGVQSTGASKANLQMVSDGEVKMAIVQNDVMDYAFNGTNTFAESGKLTGFSAVCTLYAEVIQIVAAPGIESVADLAGKRVSVGDAGSGVEFNAKQVLEAYGLTFDDITVQNLGFTDSADKFKDGQLDAFFITAGAPTTAITDLSTSNSFTILSIGETELQYLKDNYGYYTQYTLPGGTYANVTEDTTTVAVMATLVAADSMDEETVYTITKAIYENIPDIINAHAKGTELNVETALDGVSIPIHPGAAKYFTEVGTLVG